MPNGGGGQVGAGSTRGQAGQRSRGPGPGAGARDTGTRGVWTSFSRDRGQGRRDWAVQVSRVPCPEPHLKASIRCIYINTRTLSLRARLVIFSESSIAFKEPFSLLGVICLRVAYIGNGLTKPPDLPTLASWPRCGLPCRFVKKSFRAFISSRRLPRYD